MHSVSVTLVCYTLYILSKWLFNEGENKIHKLVGTSEKVTVTTSYSSFLKQLRQMTCGTLVSDPLIEVDGLIEVRSIGQGGH